MQITEDLDNINRSFEAAWDANRGPAQTSYFMGLMLDALPPDLRNAIRDCKILLDAGCATGEGAVMLSKHFPMANVMALDVSHVAIAHAIKRFYHMRYTVEFMTGDFKSFADGGLQADAVFCSNVLEHFSIPMLPFADLARITKDYLIVMTPYNEQKLIPGHYATIDKHTFPDRYENATTPKPFSMVRIFQEILDTRGSGFWHGDQILQVYQKTD